MLVIPFHLPAHDWLHVNSHLSWASARWPVVVSWGAPRFVGNIRKHTSVTKKQQQNIHVRVDHHQGSHGSRGSKNRLICKTWLTKRHNCQSNWIYKKNDSRSTSPITKGKCESVSKSIGHVGNRFNSIPSLAIPIRHFHTVGKIKKIWSPGNK